MKSMTGYGRGEARSKEVAVTCEMSSVNQKARDIFLRCPRDLEGLEPRIKEAISQRVVRGKLSVSIVIHPADSSGTGSGPVDTAAAKRALAALRKLQKELGLSGEIRIDTLLRVPGILGGGSASYDSDALWPLVKQATEKALDTLLKMRSREGAFLRKDLVTRLKNLRKLHTQIAGLAPLVVQKHRKSLHERIQAAGVDIDEGDERLIKEIVFFADRSDISEELTRLESHFEQMRGALDSGEPVGRTLDFLIQEMNREVNTIGSKANNVDISRCVVDLKAELEKLREQIQNIE
ncbi:YicC/YloC family endoribonuclease [Oscillatoria amoena NRMC-F 0135]|nr:YicC/YloC family endoribonuclease [Oscillatoria laete-virens]MDL5045786.1 YicC/YloC family endoribonuclease [Oscillatoria amoena NRMC-F 0135]MDL5055158.1 YicC/YloC family endoribonuclease [Oscillatoria laete-virens NRMC-F 0139]